MTERMPSAVLAEAAVAGGFAPSVHNTQPWRWKVSAGRLDLFADRGRQLSVADPLGRLLVMSCGAALHHVRVALAAEGWSAIIDRLPDPDDSDHLAGVTLGEHVGPQANDTRHFQTVRLRRTDRRPVSETPIRAEDVDAVRRACTAEGIDMHRLTPDQVIELGSASAHADEIGVADLEQRHELAYWVGGDRPGGTGVPDATLLDGPSESIVPGRDFVRYGAVSAQGGHDRSAVYMVLFGADDEPVDWLRAGEAMSAAWLAATEHGLSVLPFSAVIEVTTTRETLRRMLSFVGYPYLVLRLGMPDPVHAPAPHTPRLASDQLIEIA